MYSKLHGDQCGEGDGGEDNVVLNMEDLNIIVDKVKKALRGMSTGKAGEEDCLSMNLI